MPALVRSVSSGPVILGLCLAFAAGVGTAVAQQDISSAPVDSFPQLQWVPAADGAVPSSAISGGGDAGTPLFVCRAEVADPEGTRRVGTLRSGGSCEVPMGTGGTAALSSYEVLTGPPWRVLWERRIGSAIREDVVVGGRWRGQPVPLCQIDDDGGVHTGMLVGDRCMVAVGRKTMTVDDFRYAAANAQGRFSMRWASGGWVPQGALTAGTGPDTGSGTGSDSGPVLCLAEAGGTWWPGALEADGCTAATGSAGVVRTTAYQVVIGDPGRVVWTRFTKGRQPLFLPQDTVAIGGAAADGPPVRICRGAVDGRMVPGHVATGEAAPSGIGDGVCVLAGPDGGPDGGSVRRADYDVLLYRQNGIQAAARR